jgi:hypothetical protein
MRKTWANVMGRCPDCDSWAPLYRLEGTALSRVCFSCLEKRKPRPVEPLPDGSYLAIVPVEGIIGKGSL